MLFCPSLRQEREEYSFGSRLLTMKIQRGNQLPNLVRIGTKMPVLSGRALEELEIWAGRTRINRKL
jgi:hypothetical protein